MSSMAAASPNERPVMLVISDTKSRLIIRKMVVRIIGVINRLTYKIQVLGLETNNTFRFEFIKLINHIFTIILNKRFTAGVKALLDKILGQKRPFIYPNNPLPNNLKS